MAAAEETPPICVGARVRPEIAAETEVAPVVGPVVSERRI